MHQPPETTDSAQKVCPQIRKICKQSRQTCRSSLSYQQFVKKGTTLAASHVSLLTYSYIRMLYIHTDTKITAGVSTSIFQTSKTHLQLLQHRYTHCNNLCSTLRAEELSLKVQHSHSTTNISTVIA